MITIPPKLKLILIISILISVIAIVVVAADQNTQKSPQLVPEVTAEDVTIGLSSYGFPVVEESVKVLKSKIINEQWMLVSAELTDEPEESEARIMSYLFKIEDDAINLIAYSGDSFSQNSSPGTEIPKEVISEVNKKW